MLHAGLSSGSRMRCARLALAGLLVLFARAGVDAAVLQVTGMTFVSSRDSVREIVVRSQHAKFHTDTKVAELDGVRAEVSEGAKGRSFTMTCDRAELDLQKNDFLAQGDVEGETEEGQRVWAPWVRYDHAKGVVFSDAPVRMTDKSGSFRGDGFRYHVKDRRFQLLGNVRVEQIQ
ncbi:MAG TPA: LPS export ABC transporter periplasmic protein LptC [Myxococcota bacterium]|nr:LPS export ABC transporter periplasmic protein LptC [Myxococcota bacterium]